MRAGQVAHRDFNEKREKTNYRNFGCTYVVKNAHSERINCLCYLVNGTFATGSSDKFLRVWRPLDQKPLGNLEEDMSVTLMVRMGKTQQQDVTMLYVAQKVLRYLSIKQQKAIFLYRDEQEITAIAKVNSDSIVVIGTANGMIKDFDVKSKCIIRNAKIHNGARIAAIISQGNYLISCSPDNGLVVIYDYKNQQLYKELNTRG